VSLPHVLLGLLDQAPATGYELSRSLRERMDPVWRAGFSQIYPTLRILRRRGWVVLRVLGPRRGPRRNLYRTTAEGRRELRRWMLSVSAVRVRNDEVLARIALAGTLPAGERRRALAAAEAALAAEILRIHSLPAADEFPRLARRAALEELEAVLRILRRSRSIGTR
jgi:PadR family transcriptional regulator AphA